MTMAILEEAASPIIRPRFPNKDPDRGVAVERGYSLMLDSTSRSSEYSRAADSITRRLDAFQRCGKDAFYRAYQHKNHGASYQWAKAPCNESGHENCCWWHAIRDLESKWSHHLNAHYSWREGIVILMLSADIKDARIFKGKLQNLIKRRPLWRLLGRTMGYIRATPDGYVLTLLVRKHDLDLVPDAEGLWREIAGSSATVSTAKVSAYTPPVEVLAELRCQAEQAIPLLVDSGAITAQDGLRRFQAEFEVNRVVFGPGFRVSPETTSSSTEAIPSCDNSSDNNMEEEQMNPFDRGEESEGMTFWSNDSESLDENVTAHGFTGSEVTPTPQTDDAGWQPCRVCGDPSCGQKPMQNVPMMYYSKVKYLRESGFLVATNDPEVVKVREHKLWDAYFDTFTPGHAPEDISCE